MCQSFLLATIPQFANWGHLSNLFVRVLGHSVHSPSTISTELQEDAPSRSYKKFTGS